MGNVCERVTDESVPCNLFHMFRSVAGVREERDLFVRLVDSQSRQVSAMRTILFHCDIVWEKASLKTNIRIKCPKETLKLVGGR